ncbi:MAG: hypothetical protein L3J41_00425 [Melioribacteraceae bacterium]|nr:hypothetical protein [Melioribacteraceae bacterium]
MNRTFKNYIILFLFLFIELNAQGGPVYSRYGIGDQIHSSSARRLGFGSLGSAVIDKDYIDGYNPASWTGLYFTRFDISLKYLGANYSDQNNSSFNTNVIFSGFTIGFPVERDLGISMAIGLIPVAALSYDIKDKKSNTLIGDYNEMFSGKGSLSKIFFGSSIKIPTNTSIGASIEYYTGTNNYKSEIDFLETSKFSDVSYETRYKYSGLGGTISLITGNIFELINESNTEFRLSVLANFTSDLVTDTSLTTNTSIGELVPNEGETTTIIPAKYTFGASLTWNKKFLLLFDYLYQPWTNYQFNGKYEPNLKDLKKYSLGFEYKDKTIGMHATTFEQMSFRAGVSYEETQYTFNGININSLSVHGGVTIPFGTINLIDFSISAGVRGTTDSNLIKEEFISGGITLTLGELWFVRQDR